MGRVGRHPSVVSMLACSSTGSHPFIIMDYCANGDLKSYLQHLRTNDFRFSMLNTSDDDGECAFCTFN